MKVKSFHVQGVLSVAMGAFLVAYLISGRGGLAFVLMFSMAFALLLLLYFGAVTLMAKAARSDKVMKEVEQHLSSVDALPTAEARRIAMSLLLDPKLFKGVETPVRDDSLASLGGTLKELFSRFERITAVQGETVLDRRKISPSTLRSGFVRVGTDSDFTEIVARPAEDMVFLIDGSEASDPPVEEGYPTIYHFIVASYEEVPPKAR